MPKRRTGTAVPPEETEGVWSIEAGAPSQAGKRPKAYASNSTEQLTYDNPYGQEVERVWFDGKVVFAIEAGEVEVDLSRVKVAQEYQVVYSVQLDKRGKKKGEPEMVPGQYNIYDSVPGMDKYSPLWQFNYVIVPRDYKAQTLRSEDDCLHSGYPIQKSTVVEN